MGPREYPEWRGATRSNTGAFNVPFFSQNDQNAPSQAKEDQRSNKVKILTK